MEERLHWQKGGSSTGPSKNVVPNLTGEGAPNDDVLHGFLGLITKGTMVIVRYVVMSMPCCGLAADEGSEPSEHLDAKGGPVAPRDAPEWGGGRAGKEGLMTRPGGVFRVGSPAPGKSTKTVGEGDGPKQPPELHMLDQRS